MRALVVHAHPSPDSFSVAVLDAVERGLDRGGHDTRVRRLYDEAFPAVMTAEERRAYHDPDPILDPAVRAHADDVRWAEVLVFVYPTWWAGPPAVLKGWFERVLVNGVAFHLEPVAGGHTVRPALRHVRVLVGVTTYGSPRWFVRAVGDAGRRTILRALWLVCPRRTRRVWLGLPNVDGATAGDRRRFLARVEHTMASL